MALADLDELLVRATFSSMPLAASISSVSLEVAQPGPSAGPRALEVEECRCPPGYVGLSCQVSVASPSASALVQLGQQAGQLAFPWPVMAALTIMFCAVSHLFFRTPTRDMELSPLHRFFLNRASEG